MSIGKMRPELPSKVLIPKPFAHSRICDGPKLRSIGSSTAQRDPKRVAKISNGSECDRFKPPLPASRNLRPTEGMASNSSTATPARASTSAAISPAGPPPTMATAIGGRLATGMRLGKSGLGGAAV